MARPSDSSRCLPQLRAAVLEAVIASGRAVDDVAGAFAIAWWTVQATINTAVMTLSAVDDIRVRPLGIDEHRIRTVRFFRDPCTSAWKRVDPWMTTLHELRRLHARSAQAHRGFLTTTSTTSPPGAP